MPEKQTAAEIREFIIKNHREGKKDWQKYTFEQCVEAWRDYDCFPFFLKMFFNHEILVKKGQKRMNKFRGKNRG